MFALALVATIAVPAAAQAHTPKKEMGFCTVISTKSVQLETRLTDLQTKLSRAQDERIAKLNQLRADRDARLQAKRAQAVAPSEASIQAAIAARKVAVDTAMKTFRDGLDQLLAAHKASIINITTAYKTAVEDAVAKAKSDCAAGGAPATVRATFMATMKSAKDKMQTDRKALEKLGPQAEALAKTRNAEVQKAMEDFKTAMEKAHTDFK